MFNGYTVEAFRYVSPDGEVGWETKSWPMRDPIHDFWVSDSRFFRVKIEIKEFKVSRGTIEVFEEIQNVPDGERKAILEAIAAWEKQILDIRAVIEEETSRLPATAHSAFEGRASDLTVGSDGEIKGVARPENPEDRFD
jgi:hypothetical protein